MDEIQTTEHQEIFEFKIKEGMTDGDTSASTYNSLAQFLDDTNGVDISPGDKLELSVILTNGYGPGAAETSFTYNGTADTTEFNAREILADGLKTSVVDKVNSQGMCELEITIEDTVAKFATTKANPTVEDYTDKLEITALQVDVYVSKDIPVIAGSSGPLLTDTTKYHKYTMNWDTNALNNNNFGILREAYDRTNTSSIVNESFKLTIKNNDVLPGTDTTKTLTELIPKKRVSIVVTATNNYGNGVRRITDSYDGFGINWNSSTVVDSSGHNHDSPDDKIFYEKNWGLGTYPTDGQGASTSYSIYILPGPRTTFIMKNHTITMETLVNTRTFNGLTRDSDLTLEVLLEQTETLSLTGTNDKLEIEMVMVKLYTMNSINENSNSDGVEHSVRFFFDKQGKKLKSQSDATYNDDYKQYVSYEYIDGAQEEHNNTPYNRSIATSNYTRQVTHDHETQASAQTIQSFTLDFNFDDNDIDTKNLGAELGESMKIKKGMVVKLEVKSFTAYQMANDRYTDSNGEVQYGQTFGNGKSSSTFQYGLSGHNESSKSSSARDDTSVTFEEKMFVFMSYPAIFIDSALRNTSNYNVIADSLVAKYNTIEDNDAIIDLNFMRELDDQYDDDATFTDGDGNALDRSNALEDVDDFADLIDVVGASVFAVDESSNTNGEFGAIIAGNSNVMQQGLKKNSKMSLIDRIAGLPPFYTEPNQEDSGQGTHRQTVNIEFKLELSGESSVTMIDFAVGNSGDFNNSGDHGVPSPDRTTSLYFLNADINNLSIDSFSAIKQNVDGTNFDQILSAEALNGKTTLTPTIVVTSTAGDGSTFTDTLTGGTFTIVDTVLNLDDATTLDIHTAANYTNTDVSGRYLNQFTTRLNWTAAANKTNPLKASVEVYMYAGDGSGKDATVTVNADTGVVTGDYVNLAQVEQYVNLSNGEVATSKSALLTSLGEDAELSLINKLDGINVDYPISTHIAPSSYLNNALYGAWLRGVVKIESDVKHFAGQSGKMSDHPNRFDTTTGLTSLKTKYYLTPVVYLYAKPSAVISGNKAVITSNGYSLDLAVQLNGSGQGVDDVVLLFHGTNDGLGTVQNYNNNKNINISKEYTFPAGDTITLNDTNVPITHAILTIGDGYNDDKEIEIEYGVTTWETLKTALGSTVGLPPFAARDSTDGTLHTADTVYVIRDADDNDTIELDEAIKLVTTTVNLLASNMKIEFGMKQGGTFTGLAPVETPTVTIFKDSVYGTYLSHATEKIEIVDRDSGNLDTDDILIMSLSNANTTNANTVASTLVTADVGGQSILTQEQ